MRRALLPLICVFTFFISIGAAWKEESWVTIDFRGLMEKAPLVQGKNYFSSSNGDSVSVDLCRFYISDLEVMSGEKVLGKYDCRLVDLFDTTTCKLKFSVAEGTVTSIHFNLGIDSLTNVSGAGAGELDPAKGMYWTWQSGYINFKLEGKSKKCTTNRGEFNYHLGGYEGDDYCLRYVDVPAYGNRIQVGVNVMRFFSQLDIHETPRVMSPGPRSVELSSNAAKMFYSIR